MLLMNRKMFVMMLKMHMILCWGYCLVMRVNDMKYGLKPKCSQTMSVFLRLNNGSQKLKLTQMLMVLLMMSVQVTVCQMWAVNSQTSSRSRTSSSSKLKAAAERAAVLARVKVLKERHAIEEEEAKLRRRKEMLVLEAELAAFEAKMEIYNTNTECQSQACSSVKSTSSKKVTKMRAWFKQETPLPKSLLLMTTNNK